MSHFTALVALPAGTEDVQKELEVRLERFDENRQVEPYKKFEEGGPEEFWAVSSIRRGAQELADNAPYTIAPRDSFLGTRGDEVYVSGLGYVTQEQYEQYQRNGRELDAKAAEILGPAPTTWEKAVRAYNERWHPANQPATGEEPQEDPDDGERLHYDAETERAYTWSTYNPDSKWDWWVIGGRWTGYFRLKAVTDDVELGRPGTFGNSPEAMGPGLRGDVAPVGLIDLEAMRGDAAATAHAEFDAWEELTELCPPAKSWAHFTGLVDAGEISIDDAREQYGNQPLIKASRSDSWRRRLGSGMFGDPVEQFATTREEYVRLACNEAVPGYAFLDLERNWVAPGEMGWWGMSSDDDGSRAVYQAQVNEYIDKLRPEDILVALDLHI